MYKNPKFFHIFFGKRVTILWICLFSLSTYTIGQDKDTVSLDFTYKLNSEGSGFELDHLKYYISSPVFKNKMNNSNFSLDSFYLVNHSEKEKTEFNLLIPSDLSYDSLCFTVGIDSLTNAKGIGELDLDPIHGMYWTWHTGYINVKIEGTSMKSNARNNDVTYHLGGFLEGFRCDKSICLATNSSTNHHSIQLDLDHFFTLVDIESVPYIMSPKKEAVIMSSSFVKSIELLAK